MGPQDTPSAHPAPRFPFPLGAPAGQETWAKGSHLTPGGTRAGGAERSQGWEHGACGRGCLPRAFFLGCPHPNTPNPPAAPLLLSRSPLSRLNPLGLRSPSECHLHGHSPALNPHPLSVSITASWAACPRPQRFHTHLWDESLIPCRRRKLLAASAGAYPPTSPPGTWHSLAGQCVAGRCEPGLKAQWVGAGEGRTSRAEGSTCEGPGACRSKELSVARTRSALGAQAGGAEGRAHGPFGQVEDAQRGEPGTLGASYLCRLRDGHHFGPRQVGASGPLQVQGDPRVRGAGLWTEMRNSPGHVLVEVRRAVQGRVNQ